MRDLHLGYNALGSPINLTPKDRKTHMHVIGSSGSGKSKFLEWMMRGDLSNRQGFCLIDPHGTLYQAVSDYCAHKVLDREIILLNLSEPGSVIGFNPFRRAEHGDISVQVDRRIAATMRAWNVENTDETPTLDRTLRLIYTVMLELNLGLPQVRHLIDFDAQEIRKTLIDRLPSSLIQQEWGELNSLRAADWRKETLSAKNRLFKFLTSDTLARFMGVPDRSLNLRCVMDEGKVLLVNLAPSDHLSHENARVFGALLVNEFYETAIRRKKDDFDGDPKPYYLYMDEFQKFIGLDIDDMLDECRKFGLFLVLAHQRFTQLDPSLLAAILTHCKIKAVFGGLPYQDACTLANEMFLPDLNTRQIKKAYYHTIHLYEEQTRSVRSRAVTEGTSEAKNWAKSRGTSVSEGTTSGHTYGSGNASGYTSQSGTGANLGSSFSAIGDNPDALGTEGWYGQSQVESSFSSSGLSGSEVQFSSSSESEMFVTSESESSTEGRSVGSNRSVSEGESVVPVFVPIPLQELGSEAEWSREEKVSKVAEMLKYQQERHCFIKIHNQKTQPMLVPFVKSYYTSEANKQWYTEKLLTKHGALPSNEVDRLIESQENVLLKTATLAQEQNDSDPPLKKKGRATAPPKVKGGRSARKSLFSKIDPQDLLEDE
jgi:hypothetical protein